MNLAIVIRRFPPQHVGGAEMQAQGLAAELASAHQVRVITGRFDGLPSRETCDGYRIERVREITLPGARSPFAVLTGTAAAVARKERPDAYICYQTITSGLIGALASRLTGVPSFCWIRGQAEYNDQAPLEWRLALPFVIRHSRRVLVQTDRMRQEMLACIGERSGRTGAILARKIAVIPNGLPPAQSPPAGPGNRAIVFVGRLIPSKGVDVLLEALDGWRAPPCLIVGDGPDRPRLEALAQGRNVRFLGSLPRSAVDQTLSQARTLALPSRHEGMPNVVLEAMRLGVPPVATAVGGIPDIVTDGRTGLLVPTEDPRALRSALQRLDSEPETWSRLSRAAVESVRRYQWPAVAAALLELIQGAEPQTNHPTAAIPCS